VRTQNLLRTVRLVLSAICLAFFCIIVYLGYLLFR
jgi:TRAP-type C4-dicarboxylate transport system permease small subunit